ncbi:Hypothetical protein FKW44_007168 [Caligus rogercresseyi]|uniref:Uncharacterized protein n=1 Tax=Caligus rogercresseyi TaxID=217165 RepID=A0A7T8KED0_CALRO|nr:Hypothetical protein FKW44_007168 [Caligus rogercresseyi]
MHKFCTSDEESRYPTSLDCTIQKMQQDWPQECEDLRLSKSHSSSLITLLECVQVRQTAPS